MYDFKYYTELHLKETIESEILIVLMMSNPNECFQYNALQKIENRYV